MIIHTRSHESSQRTNSREPRDCPDQSRERGKLVSIRDKKKREQSVMRAEEDLCPRHAQMWCLVDNSKLDIPSIGRCLHCTG